VLRYFLKRSCSFILCKDPFISVFMSNYNPWTYSNNLPTQFLKNLLSKPDPTLQFSRSVTCSVAFNSALYLQDVHYHNCRSNLNRSIHCLCTLNPRAVSSSNTPFQRAIQIRRQCFQSLSKEILASPVRHVQYSLRVLLLVLFQQRCLLLLSKLQQ
jgi:hypothetical protein